MYQGRRAGQSAVAGIAIAAVLWLAASASLQAQTSPSDSKFQIAYLRPDSPALKPVEALVKEHRILEHIQSSMAFVQLPRPLLLRFGECKDEDAWYDPNEHVVSFCYELVAHIQRIAPRHLQADIEREDALLGSVYFSFLHEIAHAMFDMLELPVLGREEDAADQLAAYTLLVLLDKPLARRMIGGAAWMWAQEARSDEPDRGDLADVHSLSAQRFFNLLCIAYGSDPTTFSVVTEKGYLPSDRAEGCGYEYKRLSFAVQKLFAGHVDHALLEDIREHYRKHPGNAAAGDTRSAQ